MAEQRIATVAMIAAILIGLLGCTPRVRVKANPTSCDQGIRYYRPKPYLKVVPAEVQIAKDASKIEPSLVTITLEYLPDFSEEYAIDVRPGLGIANVSIKLEDGWNLTEINQELDSQTDENISAAGDLIRAIGTVVPTASGKDDPPLKITVPATDVPLGYYEAVIGCRNDGRKQLYGFRYLGFLPYETCPTQMGGMQQACCGDPTMPLYGLTFENGRMVFKSLVAMQTQAIQQATVTAATIPSSANESAVHVQLPPVPASLTIGNARELLRDEQQRLQLASKMEIELGRVLRASFPEVEGTTANWRSLDGAWLLEINVLTPSLFKQDAIRSEAQSLVAGTANGQFLYEVTVTAP